MATPLLAHESAEWHESAGDPLSGRPGFRHSATATMEMSVAELAERMVERMVNSSNPAMELAHEWDEWHEAPG
jgi:hypothetical protein